MTFVPDRRPVRQPLLNAPPVVLWLIALFLTLHAIRTALPGDLPDTLLLRYALIPAQYAEAMALGAFHDGLFALIVPLFTYMLLHADFTHVGVNCLWLLVFGPAVARRLGTPRFLLFFIFCGIVAALVHVAVYWGSPVAVIGASGAISGLMGAGMRILYGQVHEHPGGLAPIYSRAILMFSLVWTAVNIVSGVLRIGVTGDVQLIAWVAHLGGYFSGLFAIGLFVPKSAPGFRLSR
jgi:membrane associated rhomboid family serine protease